MSSELVLFDIEADSVVPLGRPGASPEYIESGHLLYVDPSGGLWAATFDTSSGELGEGIPLLGGIMNSRGVFARYSVSKSGTAVFGFGGSVQSDVVGLAATALDGTVTPLSLRSGTFQRPRWSPSGDEIVYEGATQGSDDADHIFLYDATLQTAPRQVTFEGLNDGPVWSPDGTRVVFSSIREGTDGFDLFIKNVRDASPPQRVLSRPDDQFAHHWPSETTLLFRESADIWTVDPTQATPEPTSFLDTEERLTDARVDPLGEYVVYEAARGPGAVRIYARPFPDSGQPALISDGSFDVQPVWTPEGDAIYYLSFLGSPRPELVRANLARSPLRVLSREAIELPAGLLGAFMDMHPDGDRVLMIQQSGAAVAQGAAAAERHVLVINWFDELRARLGEGN